MLDILLRTIILLLCGMAVVAAGQLAFWTVKPWWYALRGHPRDSVVTIEPVGMIETDRVREVEGRPIASQLAHRLAEISATLSRDISDRYAVLQAANVLVPEMRVVGRETFHLIDDTNITFEVQVFRFDVMGLVTSVHNRLDAGDRVKAMIELRNPSSRLFLDINRATGADRRLVLDTAPTLNETLDTAACAIAQAYREDSGLFAGLDANGFCAFMEALQAFQSFVVQSANRLESGLAIESGQVRALIRRLESAPFDRTNAPAVDLILASLYRWEGREDAALQRLESAAAQVPNHAFVSANLQAWQKEKVAREEQASRLADARADPPDLATIEETYQKLRLQPALAALRIPEMLERLGTVSTRAEVTVAVFGSGFTPPPDPAPHPEILPVLNLVNETPEDLGGHGNIVTHLVAALLPLSEVSILPVKVLSASGAGTTGTIIQGIDRALRQGARIFVLPIGQEAPSGEAGRSLAESYRLLLDQPDVVAIAAAGIGSRREAGQIGSVTLPAALPSVVAVGGTTLDGSWASFSAGPEGIDIAAPAVDVQSTLTGSEIRGQTGTSLTTGVVAALFAAATSVNPALRQAEILDLLQTTARSGGEGQPARIDALAFIEAVIATAPDSRE